MNPSKNLNDKTQQPTSNETPEMHVHGPQNAEHELRKAYYELIETDLMFHEQSTTGQNSDSAANPQGPVGELQKLRDLYHHAFNSHRRDDRLASERWARTVKHLARALRSEAKLRFLATRTNLYPFLEGSLPEEYDLYYQTDTTRDLLDSVEEHVPPGLQEMPVEMTHYLSKGRRHLEDLNSGELKNELLRAEHIKAAHEYGRVLECMALAFEAEAQGKKTQAA